MALWQSSSTAIRSGARTNCPLYVRRVNSISVADEQSADHGFADGLLAAALGENTETGVPRNFNKY